MYLGELRTPGAPGELAAVCKPGCPEAWPEPEAGAPRPLWDHTGTRPSGALPGGSAGCGPAGGAMSLRAQGEGSRFLCFPHVLREARLCPSLSGAVSPPQGPAPTQEAHTHSYTRERSRMHTCPPMSESDTPTHVLTQTPVRTHINFTHTHPTPHVHSHTYVLIHTCVHTYKPRTHLQSCAHTRTCILTHLCTHPHSCAHAHTCAHTHVVTHCAHI